VQRRPDAERTALHRSFSSKSLAWVAILFALTACTTQHPRAPTRKPPARNPDIPVASTSGIAVLDPGSYEQDKGRIKLALAGNGSDSLAPSEVGYYLDVLQGRLKQVARQGVGVGRRGDRIVLTFLVRAGFEPGGAQISPGMREILKPLSKGLVEYRKTFLSVRIRPEEAGPAASNPRLAEQRALSVARFLVESGVASKRVVVAGVGARADQATAVKAGPENPVRIELEIEPIVHAPDDKH
jgi:outer membrane protein OmpA-like peptidoglycan-associated protein